MQNYIFLTDGLDKRTFINVLTKETTLLQFLGENLQEFTIKLNLHSTFCTPEDEIVKIRENAKLGKPLKFIKGNGEYIGAFVISQIQKTTEQTSPEGDLIAIQVELQLKEYTGKIPDDEEEEKGLKRR